MHPLHIPTALLALLAASYGHAATQSPIELKTPSGTIEGTLTTPKDDRKTPVVLIIAGSGPTDRDGNTVGAGTNNSLKMLSEELAHAGFASVRYDKRGVARSAGAALSEAELRIETYVQDAAGWIAQLKDDQRFTGVSVLGHSEGSLIGLLAIQQVPATSFVSLAGSGESLPNILRRQLRGHLPSSLAQRNEEILQSLEAGKLLPEIPTELQALYRPSVQPYLISSFKYSPANEAAKLKIPCLLIQGDRDIQVRVQDAQILHAAHSECNLKILHGMNHVLKLVPPNQAKQLASYTDPTLPINPELVQSLSTFLVSQLITKCITSPCTACGLTLLQGLPTPSSTYRISFLLQD